jgi:hypothetical protein
MFFETIEMNGGRRLASSTYNAGLSPTEASRLLALARSVVMRTERRPHPRGRMLPSIGSWHLMLPPIRGNPWSGSNGGP